MNNNFSSPDENILAYAKELSVGDPAAIPVLKEAVQQGFDAAEEECNFELPDISYQTLQNVMDGFDKWEASGEIKGSLTATETSIRDMDDARKMMELIKNRILAEPSEAMLAQAEQLAQIVKD